MEELDAKYMDIMYFIKIRWLSCGKTLKRFKDLLPEILVFIKEQNMDVEFEIIKTAKWRHELFFLCDLVEHLNILNLKLQGREQFVWDLAKIVYEFKLKLILFKSEISSDDFTHFPTLNEHYNICFIEDKKDDNIRFIAYLDTLINEFETRFSDFMKHDLAFKFLKNPFDFDSAKIVELSEIFEVKRAHIEYDIALIAQESHSKNETRVEMWKRLISENSFLVLNDVVPKYVCMFSSTYVCECTFSSLVRRKTKYRTMLSQQSLESEIRCELCKTEPDFAELAKSKKCHTSH